MNYFLTENFPLILSTIVSIVAILVPIYQARIQRKMNIMNTYLDMQSKAYRELFHTIAYYDSDVPINDLRQLYASAYDAMLVSTHTNALVIKDFCAVYRDLLSNPTDEKLIKEYKERMTILTTLLREELFRFDTIKRKSDKYFKHHHQTERQDS